MHEPDITLIASLIGEPARARMLTALMSGKALTATELALEAEITAQTASSHLAKLVDGELITVRKQGRHKYFQLKNHAIAELIEQLLSLSNTIPALKSTLGPRDPYLRRARICYDHIAGELGVKLYDALVAAQYLQDQQAQTRLTDAGYHFFSGLGVCFNTLARNKRPLCRSCLDWSERRNHLAGSLGHWVLTDALDKGWLIRVPNSRAIQFTKFGQRQFINTYKLQHLPDTCTPAK
ncbi:helix-turn-helix transcriptional regulator [Pseudoalteromonas sp. OOF1S-7]|uniref:ArsR/SmtB family transcription factor n=1 Tax=Pseudoalteromonas sp. OOF1S-7 TaxID=2917757 RepID=UPI001EF5CA09|nr:helix-turn-helix transcriptional regulator [Pseudoalteromonas sp. OOF1S-7]MCG7534611.1 ArsR family transcriptional regulator [Pseudoalteromonas sp. OOF1S-7]